MRQVNVDDPATEFSRLLEAVEQGERIVIARAGEPIAMLIPYVAALAPRRLGLFAGEATIKPDFDELSPDNAPAVGPIGARR